MSPDPTDQTLRVNGLHPGPLPADPAHPPAEPGSRSRLASAVDEIAPQPLAGATHPTATAQAVDRFDRTVDGWFDHLRGKPAADALFEAASRLGDWSLIWQLLNTALGVRPGAEPRHVVRVAVGLGTESLLVNQGVKRLFNRVRPEADPAVADRIRKPSTSSFPSGHASAAFTAAGLLTDEQPSLRPLFYGVAVVVAASRVHTRMHHPSDVVGGALVGVVAARLFRAGWPLPQRRSDSR